ncbi:hypothetical protein [Paenibacillus gansuensis]|uniref:Uncharacterized protein n=1 Tax=Paenibacillus gansuensis TaxID=306542 RepID=A0ABW5PHY7_9BACL
MNRKNRVVLLGGELVDFLISSSGGRFIRWFVDRSGHHAEYFLHTPDELHEVASGEMVTLVWQDGMLVGFYEGVLYANDTFSIEGEI